ncbi:MAG: LysM peptidoglycan-binding domain-containing protein [Candidatus Riflebacteria bacterium]|nr:LysM peptidoglycan-binding domain-containing protein [Candidatus Riflebacteria bacterium]
MLLLKWLRAKEALVAIFLGLALATVPNAVSGQDPNSNYSQDGGLYADALNSAPPVIRPVKVVAAPLGSQEYRPPVEPPGAGAPAAGESEIYTVQPGDTAALISKKVFGTSAKWQQLLAANGLADARNLRVGMQLKISGEASGDVAPVERAYTEQNMPVQMASAQRPATVRPQKVEPDFEVPAPEDAGSPVEPPRKRSAEIEDADASYSGSHSGAYVIQRGDTLGKIAKKTLGSAKRWREIAKSNPKMNPNKLIVGQSISIPGSGDDSGMSGQRQANAGNSNYPASYDAGAAYNSPQPTYSPPPLTPPPAMAPPPSQGIMAYPPPPPAAFAPSAPAYTPAPVMEAPPPVMVAPPPVLSSPPPVNNSERYNLPDELKPTGYTPYFANMRAAPGLFNTECAFYPFIKTWNIGFHFQYEKYKYLNDRDKVIEGRQWLLPLNLMYTGRKLTVGLSVPFQDWEVTRSGILAPTVNLSGMHDPELRVGYQIWKNLEGTHAVSLHVAGRFPGDNFHQPYTNMSGKTRTNVRVGPAEATRGSWTELGGAYSGELSNRWTSHVNLAVANDSEDGIARYMYRTAVDYKVNHNLSLVGELNGTTWEMDHGPDGANIDLLLGMVLFNERWQGILGFPMSIERQWGYGNDFGVVMGVNHRWD